MAGAQPVLLGRGQLVAIARAMLAENPDPVVRHRLLRDVLLLDPSDPQLVDARQALDTNPHVQVLATEQRADGGWGPFHSHSTRLKQRMLSTEYAAARALALGLDASHYVLARAVGYLERLLADPARFPDAPEKNDRWEAGVRLFIAGTLALIEPRNSALKPVRSLWIELTRRTFASGEYSATAEEQAHRELTGASIRGYYLELQNRYTAALLLSAPQQLPPGLAHAFVDWLWRLPRGLHYLEEALASPPPVDAGGRFDRWLTSLELVVRHPLAREQLAPALAWLAAQRNAAGCWDFGKRGSASAWFPLSASWRKAGARRQDSTARVLTLLALCAR